MFLPPDSMTAHPSVSGSKHKHIKDSKDVFISVFPEHSKISDNQWYLLVPDRNWSYLCVCSYPTLVLRSVVEIALKSTTPRHLSKPKFWELYATGDLGSSSVIEPD